MTKHSTESKYRLDPKNEDKVIECVKLVKFIINERFSAYHEYRDDLIQEGVIGLIKSMKKYDPSKPNAKFSTYASICIRNEIQKFVSEQTDPIKVPVAVRLAINKLREMDNNEASEEEKDNYLNQIQVSRNMYKCGLISSATVHLDDTCSDGRSYHELLSVELQPYKNITLEDKLVYRDFHNYLNFSYPESLLDNRVYVNYLVLKSQEVYNKTTIYSRLKKAYNVNATYTKNLIPKYTEIFRKFLENRINKKN